MFKNLIFYFLGYIGIQVEGYYIEHFINDCNKNRCVNMEHE